VLVAPFLFLGVVCKMDFKDSIRELKRMLPGFEVYAGPQIIDKGKEWASPCFHCEGSDRLFWDKAAGTINAYCRGCEKSYSTLDAYLHKQGMTEKDIPAILKEFNLEPDKVDPAPTRKFTKGESSQTTWAAGKDYNPPPTPAEQSPSTIKQLKKNRNTWKKAKAKSKEVITYLQEQRSIPIDIGDNFPLPGSIKYQSWSTKTESFSCLICCMVDITDLKPVTDFQRIWLDSDDGIKTGTSLSKDSDFNGKAIWLDPKRPLLEESIFVAEGLETSLSISYATGLTGAACTSTSLLKNVKIPENVTEINIFCDEDILKPGAKRGYAGQKAAIALGERFEKDREGNVAYIISPSDSCFTGEPVNNDFNDLLKEDPIGDSINNRFAARQKVTEIDWVSPDSTTTDEINEESDKDDHVALMENMNKNHAAVLIGGKFRIIKERTSKKDGRLDVEFLTNDAFSMFYKNKTVWIGEENKKKKYSIADLWMKWEYRRSYHGVVFAPGNNIDDGEFNLYKGLSVEPKKGEWKKFEDLMLNVICAGDEEHFLYLKCWMAHTVQLPGGDKPGVAVVLRGGKGTGKGTFANIFGQIFGGGFVPISSIDGFTGQFNMHLSKCLVCFLDEAVWGGEKRSEGRLKAMITEPTMLFQPKGIDSIPLENHMRVIMASNEDWCVPAGIGERRFFVLDVNEGRKMDFSYFKDISDQMRTGGTEAMLYDLLKFDHTQVELRSAPQTEALASQVTETIDDVLSFWKDSLMRGYLLSELRDKAPKLSTLDGINYWPTEVWKHEIYTEFGEVFCRGKQHTRDQATFWKLTKRFWDYTIVAKRKKITNQETGKKKQYPKFLLPDIDILREKFTEYCGISFVDAVAEFNTSSMAVDDEEDSCF